MAKIKGSGKEILIRTLRKFGPDKEKLFLESLSPEQRKVNDEAVSVRWVELEKEGRDNTFYKASQLLFPNDPHKLEKLGHAMAIHGFSTFYKMFLSIPTLTYLFKKAAAQWSQLYDTGKASIENITEHSATLVLREFPDYPAYLRKYMTGFYQGMAEINGAKNPRVSQIGVNPDEWKWKLEWD